MLLVFSQDGSVEFTRSPQALALISGLGAVNITRMSEIKFDIPEQCYYIQFCTGYFKGLVIHWTNGGLFRADELTEHWGDFASEHSPDLAGSLATWSNGGLGPVRCAIGPVLFDTYEDAVAVEVAFIDYLRSQGIKIC